MERRTFIKISCTLCMAVGAGLILNTISSCVPYTVFKTSISENKIAVPLALFTESNLQIIRAENYDYDIAVRKEEDGNFVALLMRCTHADNQLTNTGNGFSCNLYGSIFDKEGLVIRGPAEIPLKRLATEKTDDQLIVHIL